MRNKILSFVYIILFGLSAYANEIYNVKSVKIHASDKNASIARNIAIERGQITAFEILVKRHFPEAKVSSFKTNDILNIVAGFELSEEKISATSYSAKINVKFSKKLVDSLMKESGAKFHQKASSVRSEEQTIISKPKEVPEAQEQAVQSDIAKPTLVTLVVPVVELAGKTHWFEDDNNWLEFWHKKIFSNKLQAKFILPVGDLEDLSVLNKNILNKNIYDLTELFDRYSVNNIALVKVGDLANTPYHLSLQMNYINKYNPIWQQHNFADITGEDLKVLFNQAFDEIANFSFISNPQDIIPKGKTLEITKSNKITVNYTTGHFSDWVYLETLMNKSDYIDNFILVSMSLNQYKFSFEYKISFIDLQKWLLTHKLSLEDLGNNDFILTRDVPSDEY